MTRSERGVAMPRLPMAGFRPYVTARSEATHDALFAECNRQMYLAYGPRIDRGADRPVAYPLLAYHRLLAALTAMPAIEIVTLAELCARPDGGERVRLALRHDVDGDIVTAVAMAELERRHGARSSYYFLHTAPYHGAFHRGRFHRHEAIAGAYRQVQALGHEVGLHTDGLTVYQQHGVDGAMAVERELAWMREQGLDVLGTVAHGSKAAYGAENYEIFRGRRKGRLRDPDTVDEAPERLEHEGTRAWLRVLDEADLALVYEGNDIFFQKEIPVEYGATRAVDGWRWNAYGRRRRDRADDASPEFCCQEEMLRDIASLEPGRCVMLTVHPCYFGARHAPDRAPVLRLDDVETEVSDALGWTTYTPRRRECCAGADYQAINVANPLGMLDAPLPPPRRRRAAGPRVLFVDGGLLDGREVAVPSHAPRVLERRLRDAGRSACCATLAHRGLGIARRWPWLRHGLAHLEPTVVVLGLTTQEARWSVPAIWAAETGFSRKHPPGAYLDWRDGRVVEVPRARGWAVRQREPQRAERWPESDVPITDALATEESLRVDGVDVRRALSEMYGHAVAAVRRAGASCLLMMTEAGELAGWYDLPDHERRRRVEAFRLHAERLAARLGVALVDPYEVLEAPPRGEIVHHADHTWTAEAHRLVAEVLHRRVDEPASPR